jgi:hypothetical protein
MGLFSLASPAFVSFGRGDWRAVSCDSERSHASLGGPEAQVQPGTRGLT